MYSTRDVSGKLIDIEATFQPNFVRKEHLICSKAVFLCVSIASLMYEICDSSHPPFVLVFLTNWGLLISLAYQFVSLVGQFYGGSTQRASSSQGNLEGGTCSDTNEATTYQRTTWSLFTTAINTELIVTVLFWYLEYFPGLHLNFTAVYNHGVLLLVIIIDGFGIHRYPIRFQQIVWFYVVYVTYVAWSIIHNFATNIGNPYNQDNDPETDDDAIYDSLNWSKRPVEAIILLVIIAFAIIPLFHGSLWCLSMMLPRRYKK